MTNLHRFTKVEFSRFKAFKSFSLTLRQFNILVGPNNAGKSTVLAAFRILAAAMRRATSRKASVVEGPHGPQLGYYVDLTQLSIAEENIFFNYDDSVPAEIRFSLSNGNILILYFPERGTCILFADAGGKRCSEPSRFRAAFNCPIGFVPILGPVEHHEPLYEPEAARLALFNYKAARNFRNIWHHYPDHFDEFREAILQTWPGMDIQRPEIDISHERPRLNMYCPEERIPRELFWAGFGFQVWCQMLTHLIQSKDVSLFLIDEPDIYLHSDLQRQLVDLLRNLGPDILLATHSTEIITEAESDEIVLVSKSKRSARRINNPVELSDVFITLGSNINPILTQLAKTRRVLFLEGKDFQIIGKFARKIGERDVGNRRDFAVLPINGFNPERVRNMKEGMEATLGTKVLSAVVLDRDYRSNAECEKIETIVSTYSDYSIIHQCKEIENFLLIPSAIDRAVVERLEERKTRGSSAETHKLQTVELLEQFASEKHNYVLSQFIAGKRKFQREQNAALDESTVTEDVLKEFELLWSDQTQRLSIIPGKEALSWLNRIFQEKYGITISSTNIIHKLQPAEIPEGIRKLIQSLRQFSAQRIAA